MPKRLVSSMDNLHKKSSKNVHMKNSKVTELIKSISRKKMKNQISVPKIVFSNFDTKATGVRLNEMPLKMSKEVSMLKTKQIMKLKERKAKDKFKYAQLLLEDNQLDKLANVVNNYNEIKNQQTEAGDTLLILAAKVMNPEAVKVLLSLEADTSVRNVDN